VSLFPVTATDSPEVKHFLVWLHAHGYTEVFHAYDHQVRLTYQLSTGSSLDHMHEISRVLEDPWFGVAQ
jgi:hypothetical protein